MDNKAIVLRNEEKEVLTGGGGPEGFEGYHVESVAESNRWVVLKEGTVIHGLLMGMDTVSDPKGDRAFYMIKVIQPCQIEWKDENGIKNEGEAQKGDIVCIGDRSRLNVLRSWCQDGGKYFVYLQAVKQVKIGNGRTMWTFNVARKIVERAIDNARVPF